MSSMETLLLHVAQGVATLTLNRPRALNAIDRTMADELAQVLEALGQREDVRVLVLLGAGGHFCAGGDTKVMRDAGAQERDIAATTGRMQRYRHLTEALHAFDRPVVAAADGVVFGAGLSLLLLADLVLLGERARLCMAFGRIGLIPDCGALFTLPRVVGLARAKELAFSGREFTAREALDMGLALEVLPSDALQARAADMAARLAGGSMLALRLMKQAFNASLQSDFETMLDRETAGQAAALASDFHQQAVQAQLARTPPSR